MHREDTQVSPARFRAKPRTEEHRETNNVINVCGLLGTPGLPERHRQHILKEKERIKIE